MQPLGSKLREALAAVASANKTPTEDVITIVGNATVSPGGKINGSASN